MKRFYLCFFLCVVLTFSCVLSSCTQLLLSRNKQNTEKTDSILDLPLHDSAVCNYGEGFQDYTDYCKYFFSNQEDIEDSLKQSEFFDKVTEEDIEILNEYFDRFRNWIQNQKHAESYDFDKERIDVNDYFYIDEKYIYDENGIKKYDYSTFNVFLFDTQTKTLFYIHNNI